MEDHSVLYSKGQQQATLTKYLHLQTEMLSRWIYPQAQGKILCLDIIGYVWEMTYIVCS
jgi:hypothetical protein